MTVQPTPISGPKRLPRELELFANSVTALINRRRSRRQVGQRSTLWIVVLASAAILSLILGVFLFVFMLSAVGPIQKVTDEIVADEAVFSCGFSATQTNLKLFLSVSTVLFRCSEEADFPTLVRIEIGTSVTAISETKLWFRVVAPNGTLGFVRKSETAYFPPNL